MVTRLVREECHGLVLKESVNAVSIRGGSVDAASVKEGMHATAMKECGCECCTAQQPLPSDGVESLHPLDDLDVLSSLPLCLLPRNKREAMNHP